MKKVYMCEYCLTYSPDRNILKKHEPKCKYNPINKLCYSCKHKTRNDLFIFSDEDCCKLTASDLPSNKTCESWCSKYEIILQSS